VISLGLATLTLLSIGLAMAVTFEEECNLWNWLHLMGLAEKLRWATQLACLVHLLGGGPWPGPPLTAPWSVGLLLVLLLTRVQACMESRCGELFRLTVFAQHDTLSWSEMQLDAKAICGDLDGQEISDGRQRISRFRQLYDHVQALSSRFLDELRRPWPLPLACILVGWRGSTGLQVLLLVTALRWLNLISLHLGLILATRESHRDSYYWPRKVTRSQKSLRTLALVSLTLAELGSSGLCHYPGWAFWVTGGLLLGGQRLVEARRKSQLPKPEPKPAEAPPSSSATEAPRQTEVRPLQVILGRALLGLADPRQGERLVKIFGDVRQQLHQELGLLVPGIRIMDGCMEPNRYQIQVFGQGVAQGWLEPDRLLMLGEEQQLVEVPGEPVLEPVFRLPARWISADTIQAGLPSGCLCFRPEQVLASHLEQVVRTHADQLLSEPQLREWGESMRLHGQDRVALENILRGLLAEQVSIQPLTGLKSLFGRELSAVRLTLAEPLCRQVADSHGQITGRWLGSLESMAVHRGQEEELVRLVQSLRQLRELGHRPVVLMESSDLRQGVFRRLRPHCPDLMVLCSAELAPGYRFREAP